MSHQLVFATNNQHKLEEVQSKIGNTFKIISLNEIGCNDDIEETGLNLEENAKIKSKFIHDKFRVDCFADDTGLEIEALNNEPGVFSARYSGDRDFIKNMNLVLSNLENNPNRKARFRTVISLILKNQEYIFEGIVNGNIRTEPIGTSGFGYDPIFEPEGYAITFAEMDLTEKNKISHRGIAVQKLIDFLNQQ